MGTQRRAPDAAGHEPATNISLWQNRIVGHGEEDPRALLPHPLNPKDHPPRQRNALRAAILRYGYLDSVKVNKRTGHLLNGHLRVALAILDEQPTIPVEYVDIPKEDEPGVLATFDPIGSLAAMDANNLDEVLRLVDTGSAELQEMLSEMATKAGLYREEYSFMGEEDESAGSGGESEQSPPQSLFPLAIVLDQAEFEQWKALKERLGVRGDKDALMRLVEGVG